MMLKLLTGGLAYAETRAYLPHFSEVRNTISLDVLMLLNRFFRDLTKPMTGTSMLWVPLWIYFTVSVIF